MEAFPVANVLPLIESRFAFLVEKCGFALVQSTEAPSSAWFRNGERSVIVAYDFMRDATLEVDLLDDATGERYRLSDVLAFERDLANLRLPEVRERALVTAEMARLADVLARFCAEFLWGDLGAFRRRYREAILVGSTRAAAMREFYKGDPDRARALFEALRAYWDDCDREHYAQLDAGKTLQHVRRRG